jgi:hypothetical protein
MRKILYTILIVMLTFVLISCQNTESSPLDSNVDTIVESSEPTIVETNEPTIDPNDEYRELLYEEQRKSFLFFWETSNSTVGSNGYGLSRDRYPGNLVISSIASVGFHLASIPVGVENGWITYQEGYDRVKGTLETLLKLDRVNGFYYHFVNMQTGAREWNSEVSIIDTGLMLSGAIVAGEYFQGEIMTYVNQIYDDINWGWYVNPANQMFYMGYVPETGFGGAWDHAAEQLMLYVLAAGSKTYPTGNYLYNRIKQVVKTSYRTTYESPSNPHHYVNTFFYTYDGSLFQHQYSHAFVDFRNIVDQDGTNWFENAQRATLANYYYTIDFSNRYKTYSENSWGISASDGPGEYKAYGAQPAKSNSHNGTIALYAAVASINYLENESLRAVKHYSEISQLQGLYGFKDAYNLGPVESSYNPSIASKTPWYASDYIGIDKGITVLMIENYRSNLIWDYFMQNENVQNGLEILGFESQGD